VEEKIYEKAQSKRDAEAKVIQAGMFDQKSTHKERQELLSSIMEKSDEAFTAEIPNDEQLNFLMARNSDEFDLFQQMDKENEKYEIDYYKKLGIARKPRLMEESEIPKWLLQKETKIENMEDSYGRGLRERKLVQYIDANNKEALDEFDDDDDEEEEEDEDETSKKRKLVQVVKKSEKSNKKPKNETQLQKNISNIITQLTKYEVEKRKIASIFLHLPDFVEYYSVIKNPISFNEMKKKNSENSYQNILEFEKDLNLMSSNAKLYNSDVSIIYKDSVSLIKYYFQIKKNYSFKDDFEDTIDENLDENMDENSNDNLDENSNDNLDENSNDNLDDNSNDNLNENSNDNFDDDAELSDTINENE
jgi:SWI/SNF-related matrix-associated actin-dependent regulator of chromatin subfamily A member 2/4